MPHRCGVVTARTALVAMAASTALPPRPIVASPAWAARWSAAATMAVGAYTVAKGTRGAGTGAEPSYLAA